MSNDLTFCVVVFFFISVSKSLTLHIKKQLNSMQSVPRGSVAMLAILAAEQQN